MHFCGICGNYGTDAEYEAAGSICPTCKSPASFISTPCKPELRKQPEERPWWRAR